MRILIAPDSFKGTYTAHQVAEAIADGVRDGGAIPICMPGADGGEGTVAALTEPLGLQHLTIPTVDPWRRDATATYGLSEAGTAVIEVAAASGYRADAANRPRAALEADTYGTGLLIADAVARGARHIIVGAGGSASTDGGLGAITAITARGGLTDVQLTVLIDVAVPYCEAAEVFGPQKGADPADVEVLTRRLIDLAGQLPRDPSSVPGSGAAGGLAGGLWATFGAQMRSGAKFVLDHNGFGSVAHTASAVVVGEGRLDQQTRSGKLISAIVERVGAHRPIFAVVGSQTPDLGDYAQHFTAIHVASAPADMRRAGTAIAAAMCLISPIT
ncbi:glycerate kinase family protein [Mycobacterium sp. BMJ-28]